MLDAAWSSTFWASVGGRVLCWMETSSFIQCKAQREAGAVKAGASGFLHPWEQDHGVVGRPSLFTSGNLETAHGKITRVIISDHHEVK